MLEAYSEYLSKRDRGFLATGRGGRISIVPICFVHGKDVIYTAVDSKPKGGRLARRSNIASNPRVAFIVDRYSKNWRHLSYLLVHGDAKVLTTGTEARRGRRLLLRKYPQYGWLRLGNAPVIAIRVRRCKFWRFGDTRDTIRPRRNRQIERGLRSP